MRHISKPVNANATLRRAAPLPSGSYHCLRLALQPLAIAKYSLTLPSRCLSEHCSAVPLRSSSSHSICNATLFTAFAQLCRAAIRIAPAPYPLYSAHATPYGAVLCRSSGARSLAIALQRKASPLRNTTVHRLTAALPGAAEPLLVSAQPCNAAAPLRRRPATQCPAVALLGTSPLSHC